MLYKDVLSGDCPSFWMKPYFYVEAPTGKMIVGTL